MNKARDDRGDANSETNSRRQKRCYTKQKRNRKEDGESKEKGMGITAKSFRLNHLVVIAAVSSHDPVISIP